MYGSKPQARFGVQYHFEAMRIIGEPVTTGALKRKPCGEKLQENGEGGGQLRKEPSGGGFLRGAWLELSLYLRTIVVALGKSAALILSLAAIRRLMSFLDLTEGLEVDIINYIHAIEIASLLLIFGIFLVLDILAIRRRLRSGS